MMAAMEELLGAGWVPILDPRSREEGFLLPQAVLLRMAGGQQAVLVFRATGQAWTGCLLHLCPRKSGQQATHLQMGKLGPTAKELPESGNTSRSPNRCHDLSSAASCPDDADSQMGPRDGAGVQWSRQVGPPLV